MPRSVTPAHVDEADLPSGRDHVLEIGPGPGLTTDLLSQRVPRLTAVEVDASLAVPLKERLAGTKVDVICADATACWAGVGTHLGGHLLLDAASHALLPAPGSPLR